MPAKKKQQQQQQSQLNIFARFWRGLCWYCTFVFFFLIHCVHPPVDMWRVWRSGFDWKPVLRKLYVDVINHPQFYQEGRDAAMAAVAQGYVPLGFQQSVDFATVVGCTTGVGFEIAAGLAAVGLTVLGGMRGDDALLEQTTDALVARAKEIRRKHKLDEQEASQVRFDADGDDAFEPAVVPLHVDVSDMDSCVEFATAIKRIVGAAPNGNGLLRVCLLNAAILMTDFQRTPQGFEAQSATNALGHFVIAENLLHLGVFESGGQRNKITRDCRIVFTSSSGARFGDPLRNTFARGEEELRPETYCQFRMYGDSKALVACYAKLLQRAVLDRNDEQHDDGDGEENQSLALSVRVLHPGCIASCIVRDSGMPGGATLAKLQLTAGIAIGAMISPEQASVYGLRLLLGVSGRMKASRAAEERELFSYIHEFDRKFLAFCMENEKVLATVAERVQEHLAEWLPGGETIVG